MEAKVRAMVVGTALGSNSGRGPYHRLFWFRGKLIDTKASRSKNVIAIIESRSPMEDCKVGKIGSA